MFSRSGTGIHCISGGCCQVANCSSVGHTLLRYASFLGLRFTGISVIDKKIYMYSSTNSEMTEGGK